MNSYNVLVLSVGRRVELIRSFHEAAKELEIKSKIIAEDQSKTAPALYFADKKANLPSIDDPTYISELICIAKKEEVKLIVPTIDTNLLILSEEKEKIESESGAKVLVSDPEIVSICRDKLETQEFLENNDFLIPKLYSQEELDSNNLDFPLFIKPKSGSSSINAFKVKNLKELNNYRSFIDEPMVQDFMVGDEYTVDTFLNFEGKVITIVPRLRMTTRSGEISKGKIIKDREIINDIKRLVDVLKPVGQITIQLMKTDKGIEYIEINPRFGGGAPMSIQSGADSCKNLYQLLMNEKLEYNEDYRDDIAFLRYDNSICIDENMKIIE